MAPVSSYPEGQSALGLVHMAGNVWEWCSSPFKAYPGAPAGADPDFGAGYQAIRGGSFSDYYEDAFRCAFRNRAKPNLGRVNLGFRCLYDPHAFQQD